MSITTKIKLLNIFFHVQPNWQMNFHYSGFNSIEKIIDLLNDMVMFLAFIICLTGWILCKVLYLFHCSHAKTIRFNFANHASLEQIWTIVPGLLLLLIAGPSFTLLYLMEEIREYRQPIFVYGTPCEIHTIPLYELDKSLFLSITGQTKKSSVNFDLVCFCCPLEAIDQGDKTQVKNNDNPNLFKKIVNDPKTRVFLGVTVIIIATTTGIYVYNHPEVAQAMLSVLGFLFLPKNGGNSGGNNDDDVFTQSAEVITPPAISGFGPLGLQVNTSLPTEVITPIGTPELPTSISQASSSLPAEVNTSTSIATAELRTSSLPANSSLPAEVVVSITIPELRPSSLPASSSLSAEVIAPITTAELQPSISQASTSEIIAIDQAPFSPRFEAHKQAVTCLLTPVRLDSPVNRSLSTFSARGISDTTLSAGEQALEQFQVLPDSLSSKTNRICYLCQSNIPHHCKLKK